MEKVTVVGTGAMGCLFAARLASVAEVSVLDSWAAGLEAIRERGIQIRGDDGDACHDGLVSEWVGILDPPRGAGESDLVLVLVKAWQTSAVAPWTAGLLSKDGIALTLQNGLGNAEALGRSCGIRRVVAGATNVGATLVSPGVVRHAGGDEVILPEGPAASRAGHLLSAAAFRVRYVRDAAALLWGKLVVSAAINPVGALFRLTNGELIRLPEARELMVSSALEAAAVAAARDIPLPFSDPAARVLEVAEATASNRCSMLQDVEAGRPTEIEAISGSVVQAADEAGVPAPVNRELRRRVLEISSRSAGAGA